MPDYLGIDTSNYTTSLCILNTENNTVRHIKKLLPVKDGELGLRQSDALFHHIKQLPELICELGQYSCDFKSIGVSTKPRNSSDSYMPCFLAGESFARSIGYLNKINVYETSHQVGHILAALFSCNKLDLLKEKFIAFHVSGGTTDCLLVEPDDDSIISITQISSSLDLKAGKAVDRVGLMLGLKFPCGKELEKLALESKRTYKIGPSMKNLDCSLSGVENKCRQMLSINESKENIAKFCLDFILVSIDEMTRRACEVYGDLPVVFAGGVMSNSIIRNAITHKYNAYFAEPDFSCDNACGTALYAFLKEQK